MCIVSEEKVHEEHVNVTTNSSSIIEEVHKKHVNTTTNSDSIIGNKTLSMLFLQAVEEDYENSKDEFGLLFTTTATEVKTKATFNCDKVHTRTEHLFSQAKAMGRVIDIW